VAFAFWLVSVALLVASVRVLQTLTLRASLGLNDRMSKAAVIAGDITYPGGTAGTLIFAQAALTGASMSSWLTCTDTAETARKKRTAAVIFLSGRWEAMTG